MELTEKIETINLQLSDLFGIDTSSSNPIYRVVWSNDQFEYRFGTWSDFDKNDILIRTVEESRLVPKYYNKKDRYILEKLVAVPEINKEELDKKVSYEPLWVFENMDTGEYIPPHIEICKFIVRTVQEAMHRPKGFKRYVENEAKNFGFLGGDNKQERMKDIKEKLFGNETPITDALMAQRGVSYSGLDSKNPSSIVLTDKE